MDREAVRKMLQEVIQQQQVTLTWWTYLMGNGAYLQIQTVCRETPTFLNF
jgi:hypothetical protein